MRRLIAAATLAALAFGAPTVFAQALPEDTMPSAARLVGEGDAYAARAAALREQIAALEARRVRLGGEDAANGGDAGGLADGRFGPSRGRREGAAVPDSQSLVALDAEIDALTLEALGYERRAKAAWRRAATIDPAASDAILRRLIDTSLD